MRFVGAQSGDVSTQGLCLVREDDDASLWRSGRRVDKPSGLGVFVFAEQGDLWLGGDARCTHEFRLDVTAWWCRTEIGTRLRARGSRAVLASSVHLVCRPRENPDGSVRSEVGEWRDVLGELPRRIHEWMPRLAQEGVVGADAIFACLGPALEIFSRYSRVEKASGEVATLREYLEHVWAAVSTEALSMIFDDADAAGLEPDARLTAMWLWTLGGGSGKTGGARCADGRRTAALTLTLSRRARGMRTRRGFRRGQRQRGEGPVMCWSSTPPGRSPRGWASTWKRASRLSRSRATRPGCSPFPSGPSTCSARTPTAATTGRGKKKAKAKQKTFFEELDEAQAAEAGWGELKGPPPGSTVLDRLHQAMILFAAGRGELLKRFLTEDGVGTDARFWKLAQSFSALYPRGSDEKRWVDGVLARKKGLGL